MAAKGLCIRWGGGWLALALALSLAGGAGAEALRGPETGLPLPRFVSLKATEGFARRGPSFNQRIDWVFRMRHMPLRITAEFGHWRRVEDPEGMGGWMHYSLLSGTRTVLVQQDRVTLHLRPDPQTLPVAILEQGVIARLLACTRDWCRLNAAGHRGWLPKTAVWGVTPTETLD